LYTSSGWEDKFEVDLEVQNRQGRTLEIVMQQIVASRRSEIFELCGCDVDVWYRERMFQAHLCGHPPSRAYTHKCCDITNLSR
jgi:hypothetical protein